MQNFFEKLELMTDEELLLLIDYLNHLETFSPVCPKDNLQTVQAPCVHLLLNENTSA